MPRTPLAFGALLFWLAAPGRAAEPFRLEVPIGCAVGRTCFIQQYFDHDPGPGAADYRCGVKVYDGHDGTDFRIPSLTEQRRGVNVLAAASGIVNSVRDGMPDMDVRVAGAESVKGRECGNGVLIFHQDGWQTQYCHMAKGSIRIRPGDRVPAGAVLGLVGESGDAAFPHLHLSVRKGVEKIDPFAPETTPAHCGAGASLWSEKARGALLYQAPEIINQGFADGNLSLSDVEEGVPASRLPRPASTAFTAYVRAIGLDEGDVLKLEVKAPDGATLAANMQPPLNANKAEFFTLTGKKRGPSYWQPGRYEAHFTVTRDGTAIVERRFTLDMPKP
ncbi:MAG TPA: M23 family metallopeptidase [Rhizomicrobium sp.]|nr:M23 family metallopeptidase [Rhizomicrobium sp.]